MIRFNPKKHARNEKRKSKSFEEFSRSKDDEREATITIGGQQIKGVIAKESPSGFVFVERIPAHPSHVLLAGNQRQPIRLNVSVDGKVITPIETTSSVEDTGCVGTTEQETNNE